MTWKVPVFLHVLCNISAIFEDIDLKFCTHIHETFPSNICYSFLKNSDFEGENFEKEKKILKILAIFGNFQNFEIWDSSSVALLILRHFL